MAENSAIDIFLRLRPVPRPSTKVIVNPTEAEVEFNIPKQAAAGLINNTREHYRFPFTGILTPEAKQDEVFERVARSIVTASLTGFNGTIFAYGQTGSGKTFTMTGGAERYVDRGIIPRAISVIFQHIAAQADTQYQVSISYLEIYNEVGYDLLNPDREVKGLEDLPQVSIQEDEEEVIHYRNLSTHHAGSEEEALNLLFLGDTNRTISETPMNLASSRSHCIFTLHITARTPGSDLVRSSKLNLVDLAGSERVGKTGVDGATLKEAKYINLSLHYLEQVIVALQERSMGMARTHVPYRNSLMTQVLRDSLGGNCRTVMVATVNPADGQLEESISTCRFAQRVALVTNTVSINEEVDPAAIIARLKQQVRELREEVRLLRGGGPERGPLTADELGRLERDVASWVGDPSPDAALDVTGDMLWVRASFTILKQMIQRAREAATAAAPGTTSSSSSSAAVLRQQQDVTDQDAASSSGRQQQQLLQQLRALELQVQQRDAEVTVLMRLLPGAPPNLQQLIATQLQQQQQQAGGKGPPAKPGPPAGGDRDAAAVRDAAMAAVGTSAAAGGTRDGEGAGANGEPVLSALLDVNLLADRHRAFEVFRKSYRQNEVIEDNRALLRAKYEEAKELGARAGGAKAAISAAKAQLEQLRAQRAVAGSLAGSSPEEVLAVPDPAEEQLKGRIEQDTAAYRGDFQRLRALKVEIEHLQLLLEQSRTRLQKDFAAWCTAIQQQQGQGQAQLGQQQQSQQQQPAVIGAGSRPATGGRSSGGPSQQATPLASSSSSGQPLPQQMMPTQQQQQRGQPPGGATRGAASLQPDPNSTLSSSSSSRSTAHLAAADLGSEQSQAAVPQQQQGQQQQDWSHVDPAVLSAASPHLTGNPAADADIIRFYEARAKLLAKLGQA